MVTLTVSADASWDPAFSAEQLRQAVQGNLRNLCLDRLEVVNLRAMFDAHGPAEGPLEAPLTALAELQKAATTPGEARACGDSSAMQKVLYITTTRGQSRHAPSRSISAADR